MITDRTASDVSLAKTLRAKLQSGQPLSNAEISILERGTMTINTLNRIENKQAELKELLANEGYYNTPIQNKMWEHTEYFKENEFRRILDNLNVLRNAFFVYADTPSTPPISFHYENINALEKVLFDIETMLNDMIDRFRECGTFECGEENES